MGRPSEYNEETADAICEAIAEGGALHKLCKERDDFPTTTTVYKWLLQHPSFADKYTRARERQADLQADLALDEAMNARDASLGRLRWDARRWHAGKLAPKKYSDKHMVAHTDAEGGPVKIQVGWIKE